MKLNFKSTLLTGSAIVAVGALMGAFSVNVAHAADAATPTADTTYTTAKTGDAGSTGAADTAGSAGDDGIQFGGSAIDITVNGVAVTGGAGGAGGVDTTMDDGEAGGAGGHGINFPSAQDGTSTAYPTILLNSTASAVGGAGGDGSDGSDGDADGAIGGNGGAGGSAAYVDANYGRVTGAGDFTGGAGGDGGDANETGGDDNLQGGTAGAGGAAIDLISDNNTVSLTSGSAVAGGAGGDGGASVGTANNRDGGAGGDGIDVDGATATITIGSGVTVAGGAGGAAGTGGSGTPGAAGTDGAGIRLDGASATLTNAGTITGGDSGAGIALDINAATATITNTGTIGSTTHTGDAIDLDFAGTTTSITNSGTVRTTSGNAIDVTAGDTLTTLNNQTGGVIAVTTGNAVNIAATGVITNFTNAGTISATTGEALVLGSTSSPDTITNTGGTFTSANVTGTEGTITVGAVDLVNTTITGGTISNTASGNAIYMGVTAQTGTFTLNNVTVTGDIVAGANAQLLKLDGTTAVTGDIALGADDDTLTLSGGSVTGAIDLEGGTNVVTVEDTFTTGGTFGATAGTAAITVADGGTFTVNHAVTTGAAALTVADGGTLHLDGADVTNGGAYTNTGTTTIDTDRTLTAATQVASTGTFNFGVGGNAGGALKQGLLSLSGGAADLTGATVGVKVDTNSGFIATGDTFKVIDGTGNITALDNTTDDYTVTDDSYVLSFVITDGTNAGVAGGDNTEAYLIATRASATSIGTNTNNDNVAVALAAIDDTGNAAVDAVQGLLNDATTQAAANAVLEAVSPTVDMGAVSAATSVAAGASNVISGRLAGVRGMGAAADEMPNSVWVQGFGGFANQDERDGVEGYDANTVGVAVGSDMEVAGGKGIVGAALSYGRTNVDSDNAARAETDVDSYQVSLYGDYDIGSNAYVEGVASYAWNSNDMKRHATSATTQNADYDSSLWNARAEVGRSYDAGADGLTLTPNVSANYWHYDADGYTETGTGALLTVGDSDMDALELGLGLDAKWSMMNEDGSKLEPVVRVGYSYDAIGDNLEVTSNFVGSAATTFDTEGADPARHTFSVGAGVDFYSADNWQVKADYDFNIKSDYTSHTGMVRAGYRF